METIRLRFFYVLFLMPLLATGQINEKENTESTSLAPAHANKMQAAHRIKSPKYKRPKVEHTARYEYYVRVEKAAKEKQKMLRELDKPQYYDKRYFGHKQIPKKRPFWKMRYCSECGIRH